jgi:hypothetical protein
VLEDCVGCHEAHTFVVEGDDCVACHADIIGGTPTAGPKAHEGQRTRLERDDRRDAVVAAVAGRSSSVSFRRSLPASFHPSSSVPFRLATTQSTSRIAPSEVLPSVLQLARGAQQQTRFNHRDHRDLTCTDCHTSRQTHGEVTLESSAQCLECHHSRRVAASRGGCARCHAGAELSAPRVVEIVMAIRGRSIERRVGFDHDQHAGVTCATCHAPGVSMAVSRTCASCHTEHHTETADCTVCHGTTARQAHTREVHTQGCAGSGCHEAARYGSMTQGRNTCLACHSNMTDHRPGRACAACHRVIFATTDAAVPAGMRR